MSNIFYPYFKKQSFKKSHLNTTEEGCSEPQPPIFSEVGHEKTKPNRCEERSPKMRNLHRCHCQQINSKYEENKKKAIGVQRIPLQYPEG